MRNILFVLASVVFDFAAQAQVDSTHWLLTTDDFTGETESKGVHDFWIPKDSKGKELGYGIGCFQPSTGFLSTDTSFAIIYSEPKWGCLEKGTLWLVHANGERTKLFADYFNCDGYLMFLTGELKNLRTSPVIKFRVEEDRASQTRDVNMPKQYMRMFIQALKSPVK
jgi:hypothetical protein